MSKLSINLGLNEGNELVATSAKGSVYAINMSDELKNYMSSLKKEDTQDIQAELLGLNEQVKLLQEHLSAARNKVDTANKFYKNVVKCNRDIAKMCIDAAVTNADLDGYTKPTKISGNNPKGKISGKSLKGSNKKSAEILKGFQCKSCGETLTPVVAKYCMKRNMELTCYPCQHPKK